MDDPAGSLPDLPLHELLRRVADRTPTPGGGSATGVACSLAASLVEMAAGFGLAHSELADRHPTMREAQSRAAELRGESLALAERELEAYTPVLEALRLPAGDAARREQLDAARSGAAEPPLALARVGAELAGLGAEIAGGGTPNLRGDAVAGTLLAEAACRAAACLVEINLADVPADGRRDDASLFVRRAWQSRLQVLEGNADTPRTEP